ncbi:MAG: hypothetical protein QM741_07595 [Rudaea sp.]|uniref:hypothetical protein n=1 Tax=Rudaea sp. TaxID=2136325 RepID=UPI0039E53AAB
MSAAIRESARSVLRRRCTARSTRNWSDRRLSGIFPAVRPTGLRILEAVAGGETFGRAAAFKGIDVADAPYRKIRRALRIRWRDNRPMKIEIATLAPYGDILFGCVKRT